MKIIHIARRSDTTNMYKQGIPTIDIFKITGHILESNFLMYIRSLKKRQLIELFLILELISQIKKLFDYEHATT